MKIRTRLAITAVLPVGFALMVGAVLWFTGLQVDEARNRAEVAFRIIEADRDLNVLAQEYLLFGEERPVVQWRIRHESLGRLIEAREPRSPHERALLEGLRRDHQEIARLFEQLIQHPTTVPISDWRQRVASQLLIKSQGMLSRARELAQTYERQVIRVQRRTDALVLALLVVLASLTVAMNTVLTRGLNRSLRRLTEGVSHIAAGDLGHEIEVARADELGELATAFNGMSRRLRESLASLAEAQQRYRNLFENMADAYALHEIILDAQGVPCDYRFLDVNPAFERMLGLKREDVVGKTVLELMPETERSWIESYGQVALTGEPMRFERYAAHFGRRFEVSATSPQRGLFAAIFTDVTERRRAEEALRSSESRLKEAQRIAHIGSWELNLTANVLRWSDEIYRIFEIDPKQFGASYEAFLQAIHPDDRAAVDFAYTHSVKTRTPYAIDHRLLFPDGRVKYVHEQCETFYGDDGTPLRSLGTVQDITERTRVEQAVRLHADRYATMLATAQDGFWAMDPDGRVLDVNDAYCDMSGYSRTELLSLRLSNIEAVETPEETAQRARKVMQSGYERFETRHRRKDGTLMDVEVTAAYRSALGQFLLFMRDITERKRAQETLRENQRFIQRVLDTSPNTIWVKDREGRLQLVNETFANFVGATKEELTGRHDLEVHHYPEAPSAYVPTEREVIETGRTIAVDEPCTDRNGEVAWWHTVKTPLVQPDGAVSVLSVAADITERKHAEEALDRASAYNRSLIEASLDPLVTIGPDGKITDVNAATETVTGHSRAELIGDDFSKYFTSPGQARAGYEQAFREGFVRDYALEIRHRDGRTTPVLYNATVYRDEAGRVMGVFAAARDITERKRAEDEVRRLSRWNKLVLDSTGEGIYGLNLEGKCTFVNPAASAMLGYADGELIGQPAHEVFHHSRSDRRPYPEADCPVQRAHQDGLVFRGSDEVYWRKDGSSFPIEYVSVPVLEEGRVVGAVTSFLDITERKRAEELLRLRARQQAELARLGQEALAATNLAAFLDRVARTTAETLGVEFCKILELLPDGGALRLQAGVGWKEGLVGRVTVSAGLESQAGYTLLSEQPVIVEDLKTEKRFQGPPLLHEHGVVSGMSVIIGRRDRPYGVLGAHTARHRIFSEDDVHYLQSVANVVSAALERRRAEETLRLASVYHRSLIEASLDPLVTIGPDGKITDVNAATEAATGLARATLIGTDFSDYFTSPGQARAGYEQAFREGYVRDYALEIRHRDGHVTPVLYNATVYRDEAGRVMGVFAAARDITERKGAEAELERYRQHLEELVRARTEALERQTAQLEAANIKLRELDRLKSMFIASMSHELRTPLNTIIGFTGIILQGMVGDINAEQRKQLTMVKESGGHLLSLVNDVIDISKIEAGKVELSIAPFDLVELVKEVADSVAVAVRTKGLELSVAAPDRLLIESDRRRVRQILVNLVGNAIKFTDRGRIEFHLRARDSGAEIAVRDTGIGITKEDIGKLFTAFSQLVTKGRPKEGSGLGLYLSQKIANLLGGGINVQSELGAGSTFTVSLPTKVGD